MIRAVCFDLDGTLADTENDLILAVNHCLNKFGTEIFIHGLHHLRASPTFSPVKDIMGGLLGGKEAELLFLSPEHKWAICKEAYERFQNAGIETTGFVAPTWHGAPKPEMLKPFFLQNTESRFFVFDLIAGRCLFIPPVSFGGGMLTSRLSYLLSNLWWPLVNKFGVIRLVLHPGDLQKGFLKRSIQKMLQSARPIQYRDLFL